MTASPDNELPADPEATARPAAPTRLRDRLREQTHAAILDAAERTVTDEGTALARIDAIAAAAGVSVGTLYNHFADRDALVAAVIEDRRRALLGYLTELVDDQTSDFTSKIRRFFDVFAQAGARHGRFFAVVMGEQGGVRSWQCQREEMITAWFSLSRQLIEQGVREDVLRGDALDLHAILLMTLARTAMIGPLLPQKSLVVPPITSEAMAKFFLHGAGLHRANAYLHDTHPPAGDGSGL
jgi:AcrR family transcriptional regulator